MNRNTVRDVERRLADTPAGEPPADLAARLRADLPERLELATAAPAPGPRRPPRWLATAAAVVLAVGGGWMLWRLSHQVAPADRGAMVVEEAAVAPPSVTEAEVSTPERLQQGAAGDAVGSQVGNADGVGTRGRRETNQEDADSRIASLAEPRRPTDGAATDQAPSAPLAAAPTREPGLAPPPAPPPPSESLRRRQSSANQSLAVPDYARLATTLRVSVTHGDLRPGAEVTLVAPDGSTRRQVVGHAGHVDFQVDEPGRYRLQARSGPNAPQQVIEIAVGDERTGLVSTTIDLLPAAVETVVEARQATGGGPLPGVAVILEAPGRQRYRSTTDVQGQSVLRLPPGRHRLTATREGLLDRSIEIEVSPTREPVHVAVAMEAVGAEGIAASSGDLPAFGESVTVVGETVALQSAMATVSAAPVSPPPPTRTGRGPAETDSSSRKSMSFRHYGVHPVIDTADDRLSTFGLDVDTGSWGLVGAFLDRGELPPAAALRIEEVVNALDYGDPSPERGETFRVRAEGAPTPFTAGPRDRLLRFGIRARTVDPGARRPAVLTFVVDVSGSMASGGRLELVKDALGLLLDQLGPADRLAVVAFSDEARVVLPPTADAADARRAIATLRPEGSTNAEAGLALGYRLAWREKRPGRSNRVVLLSDGVANVGATSAESLLARAAGAAADGIELTTVGVGMGNYDDVLLEQLANRGDGRYSYVDDVAGARRLFVEQLTGTLETVAEEARAQVEFDPRAVERWRLLGYENRAIEDHRFRHDDSVDAGEVGAGHTVTALYEVTLVEGSPPGRPLAHLTLRWREPESGRFREVGQRLTAGDLADGWDAAPRSLRLAAVAAELAEQLRDPSKTTASARSELARSAAAVATDFPGDERAARLAQLAALAARAAGEPGRDD